MVIDFFSEKELDLRARNNSLQLAKIHHTYGPRKFISGKSQTCTEQTLKNQEWK